MFFSAPPWCWFLPDWRCCFCIKANFNLRKYQCRGVPLLVFDVLFFDRRFPAGAVGELDASDENLLGVFGFFLLGDVLGVYRASRGRSRAKDQRFGFARRNLFLAVELSSSDFLRGVGVEK